MYPYPIPPTESARIASLHSYRILDTPTDAGFEDIVDAVRRSLRVPIALVSLVDTDRQWFKARRGIDPTETSRELAFCAYAILGSDPMVVEDTLKDERFCGHPFVVGVPHIRFYLGVPILTPGGEKIGTVCAIDTVPQIPCHSDLKIMRFLARQTERLLELHRLKLERLDLLANRPIY